VSRIVIILSGALAAAVLGAVVFVVTGVYDIAANVPHTQPVHSLLEYTMRKAVQRRAAEIVPPRGIDAAATVARGAACFRAHCVQCHGGPGLAPAPIGRSMQPLPGPLVDAARRWSAAELYWLTRNGIKMSGMPAWQHRMDDADLWALAGFMRALPRLDTAAFAELTTVPPERACAPGAEPPAGPDAPARAASAERGRRALTQYACNACHRIPGVTGSDVHVGPPLGGIGRRGLLAGRLPNTPEAMVRWIRDPQSVEPQTAMPNLQVTEADAQDIAAYLATLR
jgi:mono/diheme cytochrome c family protein